MQWPKWPSPSSALFDASSRAMASTRGSTTSATRRHKRAAAGSSGTTPAKLGRWRVSAGTASTPSQSATPVTHLAVGRVTSIDAGGRSLTIDHQAIPSLGMPVMTMQFRHAPSSQSVMKPGESIAVTFTASADGLTIGSVQAIHATGNSISESPLPESTLPNTERPRMGGTADMMKSWRDMMGGKR